MADYKAEMTLNERDSLMDMLSAEKALAKLYATCLTEGVSKGFRDTVKRCLVGQLESQFKVFMLLTELDYYRVTSAKSEEIEEIKKHYLEIKEGLY